MSPAVKEMSSAIDRVFPDQVCINLDRRLERWQRMQRKFAEHRMHSVRRFSAFDGESMLLPASWTHTPGAYGCLLSHLQVVSDARRRGVSSVLVFEDDVLFADQLETRFATAIAQLPSDWDMLFFGALHRDEPIKVSDNIARITQANSTFACALRSTVFDAFIELNSQTEEVLDVNNLILQQQFNCYCFMPHLAWVETDHSDAQQRVVDHWYLRDSLVLFGPQVDRLLGDTTIVFAHSSPGESGLAGENLRYLVGYYHHYFSPHLEMIIVEQGPQPTVNPSTLPANCKYMFLPDANNFDRERCFMTGISHSDPRRRRVILSDDDLYLETLHIRANLRMCERHDYVIGFSKLIELSQHDSARLRNARWPQGIDFMKNGSGQSSREGVCLFLNREAIQGAERAHQNAASTGSLLSSLAYQDRVFQSPNHALRLQ